MKAHTVVVVLEAKPEKQADLETALRKVVEPSRLEDACIEYRLHRAKDNPCQFVLYEIWRSEEEHQKQFTKPYILELIEKLEGNLVKPYEVIFAEEIG